MNQPPIYSNTSRLSTFFIAASLLYSFIHLDWALFALSLQYWSHHWLIEKVGWRNCRKSSNTIDISHANTRVPLLQSKYCLIILFIHLFSPLLKAYSFSVPILNIDETCIGGNDTEGGRISCHFLTLILQTARLRRNVLRSYQTWGNHSVLKIPIKRHQKSTSDKNNDLNLQQNFDIILVPTVWLLLWLCGIPSQNWVY